MSEKSSQPQDEPPPYETILDIPDWKDVPAPPRYEEPLLHGFNITDAAYPPPAYTQTPPVPVQLPKLGYADFLPQCIFPGDALQHPKFDSMKTLMTIVNQWLDRNVQYQVVRCESIERKVGEKGVVESESTIRHEGTYTKNCFVRGIRLWLRPNTNGDPAQKLWYMNVVPQPAPIRIPMAVGVGFSPMGHGPVVAGPMMFASVRGFNMFPAFESLDTVLEKLNKKLKVNPLPGKVLTIETIDTKYAEGFDWKTLEPDSCCWSEKGTSNKLFLSILRLFFVMGQPDSSEIDIVDFAPLCVDTGSSVISKPKFEPFSDTVMRASAWITQQKDKRITNIQTVTAKIMNNIFLGRKEYDTKKMDFTHGLGDTTYIKIIRVPFVKTPCSHNPHLTSRAFVPIRFGPKLSETMSQTIIRANQWLDCTGVRVFGADTMEYEFLPQGERPVNTEQVRTTYVGHSSHYWMSTVRLYFDGSFQEPPPEIFQPIPPYVKQSGKQTESNCCNIL